MNNRNIVYTTEEWIKLAKDKHPDAGYDYSLVIYKGAKFSVKIICPKHGEFNQIPGSHLKGLCGCKDCAKEKRKTGRKKVTLEKSFNGHEKTKFWSEKNTMKPKDVAAFSNDKFYFNCDCGHEIHVALNKIQSGRWCSFCSKPPKQLCSRSDCEPCQNNSFASQPKSIYWSIINKLTPREVFKSSGKRYFFDCDKCLHVLNLRLDDIYAGNWCAYCSNNTLCDQEGCGDCYIKSFASHEKAIYYHSDNPKTARQVFKGSTSDKYKFWCPDCLHTFDVTLGNVINDRWCPYCSVPPKRLCDDENCQHCLHNSFLSHPNAVFWHKDNVLTPRQTFKGTLQMIKFNCLCMHTFSASLNSVSRGSWCPFCSNPPKELCENDKCEDCYNKSFASHNCSKYWSDDNVIKPRMCFKHGSTTKYNFICPECGDKYTASLNHVTEGKWCTCTKNKTETKLYKYLVATYFQYIEKQVKFEWCKNRTYLPFDFCLEEYKLIIELDGPQHFIQISNWTNPIVTQENDKYKMKCANQHGYSVIRILQEDVWNDKNDWMNVLSDAIKYYYIPTNIFLGTNYRLFGYV